MSAPSGALAVGGVVGAGVGAAVLLILAALRAARPTLAARIEPYLRAPRDAVPGWGRAAHSGYDAATPGPLGVVGRLARPWLTDATRLLERLGSTSTSIRARLDRSGSAASVEQVRAEQVAWAGVGLALGVGMALTVGTTRGAPLPALIALVGVCALCGALARDRWLTRAVRRRQERLADQLPDLAEMLALAVGAGEGAVGALDRVTRIAGGDLALELRRTLDETRAGRPLGAALTALADRTDAPGIRRFADGVAVAVERGTPLAGVLRALSADARATSRQHLMELGGKKEIAMMAPVVFLILPVTVVFALFPGLAVLQVGL